MSSPCSLCNRWTPHQCHSCGRMVCNQCSAAHEDEHDRQEARGGPQPLGGKALA